MQGEQLRRNDRRLRMLDRVHLRVIRKRNRPVSRAPRIEPSRYFSKRFHNAEKAGKYTIART